MVTVLVVQRLSANKVRLTTTEMTDGVAYNVKVSNVVSASGYPLAPLDDNKDFTGQGVRPQLVSATAIDSSHVDLVFNEEMQDSAMLQYTGNYMFDGPSSPSISNIELDPDGLTVHLTFSSKVLNGTFAISVQNVIDAGGNLVDVDHDTDSYTYTYIFPIMNMIGISDSSYTDGSLITVYTQGISTSGTYPTATLKVDDVVVATWTNIKKYIDIYFDHYWLNIVDYLHPGQVTIDQVKVEFSNALTEDPDVAGLYGWSQYEGSTATVSCEKDYLMYYAKVLLTGVQGDPSELNSLVQDLGTVTADKALTAYAQFRAPVGVQGRMELWVFPAGAGELLSADNFAGTGDWIAVELAPVTPTGAQLEPELRLITNSPDEAGSYTEWGEPHVDQELIENPNFDTVITPWYRHDNSRVVVTLLTELAGTYAHSVITKDVAPTERVYHSIAYDLLRNVSITFGGWDAVTPYFNDTWEWDYAEEAWAEITVTGGVKPSVRGRYAMVYDTSRNVFILFGGNNGVANLSDTWEYNGATSTWVEIAPAGGVKPTGRYSPAIAFDSVRNVAVLFGGNTDAGFNSENWEYNGATSTWVQISPTGGTKPSARYYSVMAYDSSKQRCVLFGGLDATARVGDTWEFNSATSTWVEITPLGGVSPTGRSEHSMVFDGVRNKCIMFAGQDGAIGVEHVVADTWEYDAATVTWQLVNVGEDPGNTNPSARVAFGMTYDPSRQIVLLFGGYTGSMNDETWIYDTTTGLWDQYEINPDPQNWGPSHWNSLVQAFGSVGYNKELKVTGKYRAAVGTTVGIAIHATPWYGDLIPTSYLTYPGTGDWEDFELFPFNTSDDHDTVEVRLIVYAPDVNGTWADFKNISVGINLLENRRFRPRTMVVDRVIVDGKGYDSSMPDVYSTGTWMPGDGSSVIPGYKGTDYLTNSGHFDYAAVDDDAIYEDVDTRIDLYRKGNGVVTVKTAGGAAIPGATVTVAQTKHSFIFGSTVHWLVWKRTEIPSWVPLIDAYEARWEEIFNLSLAPFFWSTYEPTEGAYNTSFLDNYITWSTARNNADVRGVALLYNIGENCPSWVNAKAPADVKAALLAYVTHALTTYAGRVNYWEIVDEAAIWDSSGLYTNAPGLTKLYRSEGRENLIWDVYNTARAADPTAYLEINDYSTNDRYFSLLGKLERAGVYPFDGIKLQSHLNEDVWSNQKLWWLLNTLSAFKPEVHLSEVSIFSGRPYTTGDVLLEDFADPITAWPTTAAGEAQQAIEVERFYKMAFSHPYIKSITWWDLSDFYAWGWSGSNTSIARGLLRSDMTKKPAFDVLDNLINNEWWTTTSGTTDASGEFAFRGFAGTYNVTVSKAGYTTTTQSVTLTTSGNTWTITLT
jgi:endo-1,4-beta-xylanase